MNTRRANSTLVLAAALAAVVILIAAGAAVWWMMGQAGNRDGASNPFDYDLGRYSQIDPSFIHYRQTAELPVAMRVPRAVAVAPDEGIYVAGDEAIVRLGPAGAAARRIELDAPPACLAVDETAIFVGMKDHVRRLSFEGKELSRFAPLGDRAVLTSIGLDEESVYGAAAGNKIVWRWDREGKRLGQLGRRDPEHDFPGFVVPSPYFDLATGADGLVRVVNPGRHRIEFFTPEGHHETPLGWGTSGTAVDAFCGCCNPVSIALLPDGRTVTAEKGIPRVKVYSPEGRFECVVAGPAELVPEGAQVDETRGEHKLLAVDVATDRRGRVLVLDPACRAVRVFELKESDGEGSR